MIKILVVSDIHADGQLFEKIYAYEQADYVISAGDHLMSQTWMLKYFNFFVNGNNDFLTSNPEELNFKIANFTFHLEHGHYIGYNDLRSNASMKKIAEKANVNFFITGHSHVQLLQKTQNGYAINPGSIGQPRWNSNPGYAIIKIENNNYQVELRNSSQFINQ